MVKRRRSKHSIARRKKGKGDWTVPGYNYLGPGNEIDSYLPVNEADKIAYDHDVAYGELEDKFGGDPRYYYNQDDEDFIELMRLHEKTENYQAGSTYDKVVQTGSKWAFQFKKLAAKLGLLDTKGEIIPEKMEDLKRKYDDLSLSEYELDSQGYAKRIRKHHYSKSQDKDMSNRVDRFRPHLVPLPEDGGDMEVSAASSALRKMGDETEVDPVYQEYLRPFSHSINTIMPYVLYAQSGTFSGSSTRQFTYRLDSIYDCLKESNITYVADPTPGSQVVDVTGNIEYPTMRPYWSSLYHYWTCTKSTYKIKIWQLTENARNPVDIFVYHHGAQFPPTSWTPKRYRRMHHGMRHFELHASRTTSIGPMENNGITVTGEWMPGDFHVKHEVQEDEFKQVWHKLTEVPPQANFLTFIFQKSESSDQQGVTTNLFMEIEIVYHVQWKDLKAIFQYPTGEGDFPAITDMYAQTQTALP